MGTYYNPDDNQPVVKEFVGKFTKEYNEIPDPWAVQGYETIKLLCYAMKNANSIKPDKIANELQKKNWPE